MYDATPLPSVHSPGTQDNVWGDTMARRLVARMTEAGWPPEAHFFDEEDHIFRVEARNRKWELLIDFFNRHLIPA